MKALVIGASGFVGQRLCFRLRGDGWYIRAAVRRPTSGPWNEAVPLDLESPVVSQVALDGFRVVFHAAGIAHAMKGVPTGLYRRVNVHGTAKLVDAAVEAGVERFVFFSSVRAVTDPPRTQCVDESWDEPPTDPYGLSKREAEAVVLEGGDRLARGCVVLRPTLVYGPGVKGNLERMIGAIAAGRFPPLPETGNRRSMVHVSDLAEAAIAAADDDEAAGQTYIVSDDKPCSTRELYEAISRALGRRIPNWSVPSGVLKVGGRLGDLVQRLTGQVLPLNSETIDRLLGSACYRPDRIMAELGWRPKHDVLSSVPEMVDAWLSKNK